MFNLNVIFLPFWESIVRIQHYYTRTSMSDKNIQRYRQV